jgi:hypothetical protein
MLLASDFDKSKYFRAADISGDRKLRIKNVTVADIGQGAEKERKLIVWFTDDDRGLPLNKTNIRTLSGAFGDSCDGWKGRVIVLFSTMVDFRGTLKPASRIRIPTPKGNGQSAKATPPDDDPIETLTAPVQPAGDPDDGVPW